MEQLVFDSNTWNHLTVLCALDKIMSVKYQYLKPFYSIFILKLYA